ncbi:MAG TPA: hypothetical protein VGB76_06685 [Pyrinomonadaceae bacterium]|jgi:hypothetical protein
MVNRKVTREAGVQTVSSTDDTTVVIGAPVVIKLRDKKRKKRGSSKAARRLEDYEKRMSKSARRVSRGVKNGVDTYIDNRNRSERKRRDGALVDFCENAAKGIARAISESSPVMTDYAKAMNTKQLRKQIRQFLRPIPVIA